MITDKKEHKLLQVTYREPPNLAISSNRIEMIAALSHVFFVLL